MAEFDHYNEITVTPAINPVSNSAGANGVSIDTKGYESVSFAVNVGAMTSGTITFSMEHADDNAGSAGTFSAVTGDDILGANLSFAQASDTNKSKKIGYRGKKQWVRLVSAGTYSTAVHSAVCILGHAKVVPAA